MPLRPDLQPDNTAGPRGPVGIEAWRLEMVRRPLGGRRGWESGAVVRALGGFGCSPVMSLRLSSTRLPTVLSAVSALQSLDRGSGEFARLPKETGVPYQGAPRIFSAVRWNDRRWR
jgi:hypothetical protein